MGPLQFRRQPVVEEEMDITPMIDCTFLLLIFFLVASRMDASLALNFPPARHGAIAVEKQTIMITVLKGDGDGDAVRIYKGNGPDPKTLVAGSSPADQEQEIAEYVESQAVSGRNQVLIKAEAGLKHRDVAQVARAAGQAEVQQLFVAVQEAK